MGNKFVCCLEDSVLIRKLEDGGLPEGKSMVCIVGANDEIKQASALLALDVVVEIRFGANTIGELYKQLSILANNKVHNWRVRILPKGDFIVNFPSETCLLDFLDRGMIQCGPAKVSFHRWVFPSACSVASRVSTKRLRLTGLPPSCWHPDAAKFFLKGVGNVVDIQEKRRLGNGLLQLTVLLDVGKELSVPDHLLTHFDDKIFIVLVDDLNFEVEDLAVVTGTEDNPLMMGLEEGLMILVIKHLGIWEVDLVLLVAVVLVLESLLSGEDGIPLEMGKAKVRLIVSGWEGRLIVLLFFWDLIVFRLILILSVYCQTMLKLGIGILGAFVLTTLLPLRVGILGFRRWDLEGYNLQLEPLLAILRVKMLLFWRLGKVWPPLIL